MRWFEVQRTSPLQYGIEVQTTDGATYTYGFVDGYMLRLENGNTFDGDSIPQSFQFGDISIGGNHVVLETDALYHNLIMATKENTDQSVVITHYGDSATTGTAVASISPVRAG